jgi:hypothetical protein
MRKKEEIDRQQRHDQGVETDPIAEGRAGKHL